jgi:outer membrane protein assembly factor BamA
MKVLMVALVVGLAAAAHADDELITQRQISDLIPEHHGESSSTSKNWAVLPEVGYSPDQQLNGGFKFTGRDLTPSDLTVDAEFNAAMGRQLGVDAALLAPHLLSRRVVNLDEYHYYLSPNRAFFGVGNNHVRSPLSVHSLERQRALVTFGYHVLDDLVVAVSGGPRQTRISRSSAATASRPATQDTFAGLTGIGGGRTNPLILSVIYNSRKSITRPTEGVSAIATVEHVNLNLGNDYYFTRYTADASYLHPIVSRNQILGVHVGGEYISGNGHQVPFFELASMGGAGDMRGFFPDRFVGTSRLSLNTEYRAKMAAFNFMRMWDVSVDGVLFADAGQVFISDSDASNEIHRLTSRIPSIFDGLRFSYGTGLRIALGEAILARLDVAFSNEQTGLVYLVFGHTF